MYGSSAAVGDFRSQRKCFSISGSLLLMLLLLVAQCACRPPDELYENFDVGDEYSDVDNVEYHHVKIVDGVMREDHPIIMYKEDFVSEDYDPNNSNRTSEQGRPVRRYKDIAHHRRRLQRNETEQYRALEPEKKYFDVLPPTPVAATDDGSAAAASDYKFDPSKIRAELISLVNEDAAAQEPSKELLNKRPKKYRRRTRRSTDEHVVRKRNPYLRQTAEAPDVSNFLQQFYQLMRVQVAQQPQRQTHNRHPVPGKLWNALHLPVEINTAKPNPEGIEDRFGGPGETDRVVWGSSNTRATTSRAPALSGAPSGPTRRPAPPLFHDSRPESADTSFLTRRPVSNAPPTTTRRPPAAQASATAPATENEVAVSNCVWAIVNCCSGRDDKVRYSCFEQVGCRGSFWDLNPCADNIRDNVISYVSDFYD